MKRTTIMADEQTLDRLESIAREENLSLAAVIRQALDLRVAQARRSPAFVGVGAASEGPHDMGRRAGDLEYEPESWR